MEELFRGTEGGLDQMFNKNTKAENKQREWERTNAISSIEPAIENCAKQLRINYTDIYNQLVASKMFVARKNAFQNAENPPDDLWSGSLKHVKDISVDFEKFKTCADVVKRDLSEGQILMNNIGRALEALHSIECYKLSNQFKTFVQSQIFAKLSHENGLASLCEPYSPEGKIKDLFVRVGAPLEDTSNNRSLFSLCHGEEIKTVNCCSLSGECEELSRSGLFSSSNQKNLCSAGSQNAVEQLERNIQKTCPQFVKVCEEKCTEEILAFKEDMLDVFVIPYFRNLEGFLSEDPCLDEIQSLRKAYRNHSRKRENGEGHILTLKSDADEVVDCKSGLEEMKNNEQLKQSLKAQLEEYCQEQESQANRGDKTKNPVITNQFKPKGNYSPEENSRDRDKVCQ